MFHCDPNTFITYITSSNITLDNLYCTMYPFGPTDKFREEYSSPRNYQPIADLIQTHKTELLTAIVTRWHELLTQDIPYPKLMCQGHSERFTVFSYACEAMRNGIQSGFDLFDALQEVGFNLDNPNDRGYSILHYHPYENITESSLRIISFFLTRGLMNFLLKQTHFYCDYLLYSNPNDTTILSS